MERESAVQYAALGERVRQRRREMGLTQEKLAERVDVSSSFIGHIERGEKIPSVDTLARLAACLGVGMDYLALGRKQTCDRERCALLEELRELVGAYTADWQGLRSSHRR